jgi:selenocysteine-specific elongation factor
MTGTVLSGTVKIGDAVEIVGIPQEKKVKSIQMFKHAVPFASQGDRAAICVTNLDAKLIERGTVVTPGSIKAVSAAVALVRKVKYFQKECLSGSKIHITSGHATVLSTVTFFGSEELRDLARAAVGKNIPDSTFDVRNDFLFDEELRGGGKNAGGPVLQWALLLFETPVTCQDHSVIIGSRLDLDINTKACRIAFYGRIVQSFSASEPLNLEM